MRAVVQKVSFLFLMLVSSIALADHHAISLGGLANAAMGPVSILRYLFNAASVMVGVFFFIASWQRYLKHRRNPQETPLSTVVVFFILAIALVTLPFLHQLTMLASAYAGVRGGA